jgi:hypothetical protein
MKAWTFPSALELPAPLQEFLSLSIAHGFGPVLVGGAVRDLAMERSVGDWDFELQHPAGSETRWQGLLSALRTKYQLKVEAHHVIRAVDPIDRFEWQFAPPRLEVYAAKDVFGHGDFETKVAWQLTFAEAARRRDFTVNAMGALWNGSGFELIDPFEGMKHLRAGVLVACDKAHFPKDPVRLLRAYRFAIRFDWQFDADLKDMIEHMDLSLLSAHYMQEEARKSTRPFEFWNRLQFHATLPSKFQGGIQNPQVLEQIYSRYLAEVGHSNAMLAAVFASGEGWHLLLALAGKGENETTVWRHRRDNIIALKDKTREEFIQVDEVLLKSADFAKLCQLVKAPLTWMQFSWVREVFAQYQLDWILERSWSEPVDVRSYPPEERALRKVMAWVRA